MQKQKSRSKKKTESVTKYGKTYEKFVQARASGYIYVTANQRMPKQVHSSAYIRDIG